jgi:hypothetical protein
MKITLEHNEILALQEISKGRTPHFFNTTDFERAGLIAGDVITKLGTEVLRDHTPFGTTRNYSLEHNQASAYRFQLKNNR